MEGVDQNPNLLLELDIPPDISSLQRADPSLKSWFDKVSEVDGQAEVDVLADATYVLRNGVLYECKGKTEAIA